MKKVMLLACMLAMMTIAASPTIAQTAASGPPPPAYQVADGVVTIGGDVQTSCRDFAITLGDGYDLGLSQSQQREALAQCQEQGYLTSDMDALPNTGGPPLKALIAGAGTILIAGGLLLRHRLS